MACGTDSGSDCTSEHHSGLASGSACRFLYAATEQQAASVLIRADLKTSNILLTKEGVAKIAGAQPLQPFRTCAATLSPRHAPCLLLLRHTSVSRNNLLCARTLKGKHITDADGRSPSCAPPLGRDGGLYATGPLTGRLRLDIRNLNDRHPGSLKGGPASTKLCACPSLTPMLPHFADVGLAKTMISDYFSWETVRLDFAWFVRPDPAEEASAGSGLGLKLQSGFDSSLPSRSRTFSASLMTGIIYSLHSLSLSPLGLVH